MGCFGCLEFVGRTIWRVLKFIVAGLAVIGAILIFTSVPCSVAILQYIVAAVLLVAALFMIIDSAGIEAVLNKFRFLLDELNGEVEELKNIETRLNTDVDDLEAQNKTYKEENDTHADQLKQAQTQLQALTEENQTFAINLQSQQAILTQLQNANTSYAESNRLQKLQIDRLVIIEDSARKLIDGLMSAGGDLTRVSDIISAEADKMETTSQTMERVLRELEVEKQRILQDLKDGKFDEIDIDHDESISKEEFEGYTAKKRRLAMRRWIQKKGL